MQVMEVALAEVTVQAEPPIVTVRPVMNPVPVNVIVEPPVTTPAAGLTAESVGAGVAVY